MKWLKIDPENPDREHLAEAAACLRAGQWVIFPTETVYGVGVNAENANAVDGLYALKARPRNKPLSYHFASLGDFYRFAGDTLTPAVRAWFDRLAGEPVTLVYEDSRLQRKIGVRIPTHPVACALLAAAGCPVLAPSANFSGCPAPVSGDSLDPEFCARAAIVLDAGPTTALKESTVLDISATEPRVLRQGAFVL